MSTWSVVLMYLGIGVIVGAMVMEMIGVFDLAMGIGGGIAVIGVGMYAFCVLRTFRRKKETKNELEKHT